MCRRTRGPQPRPVSVESSAPAERAPRRRRRCRSSPQCPKRNRPAGMRGSDLLVAPVTISHYLIGNDYQQQRLQPHGGVTPSSQVEEEPVARSGRQRFARATRAIGGGRLRRALVASAAALALPAALAACGSASATRVSSKSIVSVVAAENQYGNVASQIGGRYV